MWPGVRERPRFSAFSLKPTNLIVRKTLLYFFIINYFNFELLVLIKKNERKHTEVRKN